MPKYQSKRNFGFGKKMGFAGKNALRLTFGKKFQTVSSHAKRWKQAVSYFKDQGIKDAREIDKPCLEEYGCYLYMLTVAGDMSVSYAQNILSSCNVVLTCLREDYKVTVSPARIIGNRSYVREIPPQMNREKVSSAARELRFRGHERSACTIELCRDLGLRIRESVLLNCTRAHKEGIKKGYIQITRGTKGGRGNYIARKVPVHSEKLVSLERAAKLQKKSENLIEPGYNLVQHMKHVRNTFNSVKANHDLAKIHDLRAAYACERYRDITRSDAPCVAGQRIPDKDLDRHARAIISRELGHERIDVTSAYVGGRK